MARSSGISELHCIATLGLQGPLLGIDAGVLKRKYISRLFIDGSLGITALYDAESSDLAGFGGFLDAGAGLQLNPRVLMRLRAGLKMAVSPYSDGPPDFAGFYGTYLI